MLWPLWVASPSASSRSWADPESWTTGGGGAAEPSCTNVTLLTKAKPLPAFFHTYTIAPTALAGATSSTCAVETAVELKGASWSCKVLPAASTNFSPR